LRLYFIPILLLYYYYASGKYGAVYQIRLGERGRDTKGTAFVVYEDIYDAKRAVDHLSGFNVGGRYLVIMYYQPAKFERRANAEEKKRELEELRRQVKAKKQQLANNANQTE
jgi:pre-mRNA branch site protein p14